MPLEQYLAAIIQPLLTRPESIRISQTVDDMGTLFVLIVAPEDMGPVIGKSGETAKAIRHLMRIAGVKHNARVSLKINEPDGSPYRPRTQGSERELSASTTN